MRAVIARIGDQAGIDAIYWRGGVTVYETTLRSHALIEHTIAEGACHGTVILQTKGSQATELLNRFAAWISEENDRLGLCATTNHSTPLFRLDPHPALVFGQQPSTKPEYCVSYAWADDTTNGTTRENIVNELCAAAERRGITILRDKTDMRLGDQISIFMRRLSQSSRVFVILSERYLRSVYCMTELYQVWLNCRGEEKPFLDRIRVYAQPDTKIGDIFERTAHIAWWKQRHDQVRDLVRQHGEDFLSERDYAEFRRMGHFVRVVPEILSSLQDSLRPRSFAELEQYGFEAPP
jgi:internalin A